MLVILELIKIVMSPLIENDIELHHFKDELTGFEY
jgi:hypothetical protein